MFFLKLLFVTLRNSQEGGAARIPAPVFRELHLMYSIPYRRVQPFGDRSAVHLATASEDCSSIFVTVRGNSFVQEITLENDSSLRPVYTVLPPMSPSAVFLERRSGALLVSTFTDRSILTFWSRDVTFNVITLMRNNGDWLPRGNSQLVFKTQCYLNRGYASSFSEFSDAILFAIHWAEKTPLWLLDCQRDGTVSAEVQMEKQMRPFEYIAAAGIGGERLVALVLTESACLSLNRLRDHRLEHLRLFPVGPVRGVVGTRILWLGECLLVAAMGNSGCQHYVPVYELGLGPRPPTETPNANAANVQSAAGTRETAAGTRRSRESDATRSSMISTTRTRGGRGALLPKRPVCVLPRGALMASERSSGTHPLRTFLSTRLSMTNCLF